MQSLSYHKAWVTLALAIVFCHSTTAWAADTASTNTSSTLPRADIDFGALATMPEVAQGVAVNYGPLKSEELTSLEKQASKGVLVAEVELGVRYAAGMSVPQDKAKARDLLTRAAKEKVTGAKWLLGELLLSDSSRTNDTEEGIRWLTEAANDGDTVAEILLADALNRGIGVKADQSKGFDWTLKAAQASNLLAQQLLGVAYMRGEGVATNIPSARDWLLKAAQQNDAVAFHYLGLLYSFPGELQDPRRGVFWFVKAAMSGDEEAAVEVAARYTAGWSVEQDKEEGFKIYRSAALAGNAKAQDMVGSIYALGDGRDTNYSLAYFWFSKAAAQGLANSESNLGALLNDGLGTAEDDVEAVKWFELAARQGSSSGITNLQRFSRLLLSEELAEAQRRANAFRPDPPMRVADPDFLPIQCPLDQDFLVSATIWGEQTHVLVDTGATSTVMVKDNESKLGSALSAIDITSAFATNANIPIYRCPEIFIAGKKCEPLWTVVDDLKNLNRIVGADCGGVLGSDYLKNYAVVFDADRRLFSLASTADESAKKNGAAIPLVDMLGGSFKGIDGVVNGSVSVRFEIDSGDSESFSLNQGDWDRIFPKGPKHFFTERVVTVGSRVDTEKSARIERMQIGPYFYTNLIVSLEPKLESRVGNGFLSRHRATIDYPARTLYLERGKTFIDPDERNMTGMSFWQVNGRTVAAYVDKHSPASRAGIREGDEIAAVNGQPTTYADLRANKIFRSKPGEIVTLTMLRKGKVKEFKLILERML